MALILACRLSATMPMFIMNTSVPHASVLEGFLSKFTQQLAQATGKPAQYIAVHVVLDQLMTFSSTTDPCALCGLHSICKIARSVALRTATTTSCCVACCPPERTAFILGKGSKNQDFFKYFIWKHYTCTKLDELISHLKIIYCFRWYSKQLSLLGH